jgi:Uma2 family endonuclease
MATVATDIRHFTRDEFQRLADEGFFDPEERLELIEGVIYEMSPQSSRHATGVFVTMQVLQAAFGPGFMARPQLPLAIAPDSLLEPDIAVVEGRAQDFSLTQPTKAVLIVEISDTSLQQDRERKGRVYALNGIADYWLMNLRDDLLEVYRDPQDGIYRSRTVLRAGERVSPLARPEASIEVSDLIPPR